MEIPDGYIDALTDELAPFGLEFNSVTTSEDDDVTAVLFEADPESFARAYPGLGIEESYGDGWPPACLDLWLKFDRHGDPVEAEFEVFDLLAWAASVDPGLHDRLNVMHDPSDHAVAVGEALRRVLEQESSGPDDDYLD
ncbi:MAG: hypothetical protein U0R79_08315 [Propionicimonas sp.]